MKVRVFRHRSTDNWVINPAPALTYSRLKALGSIKRQPGEPCIVRIHGAAVRNQGIPEVEQSFATFREAEAFVHNHFERS